MPLSAEQLVEVREMVDEKDATAWPDEVLLLLAEDFTFADGTYNLRGFAKSLWEKKAARLHSLVQTSESGSSRALNQAFDHAVQMVKLFGEGSSGTDDNTTGYPQNTRMVRATRGGA